MTEPAPDEKGVSGLDGPISRRLNRPISRQISARVASSSVTPDQWSWAAFGTVCAGALAFAGGLPRIGGAVVHAGSVLDGVDGEVARLQGTAGASGALLDLVLDRVSDVAVLAGLAQGAGGRRIDWLLALAAANGVLTSGIVKERVGAEQQPVAQLQRSEGARAAIDRLLPWTGRDGRLFAVTVAGLLRAPRLGLAWVAVTSNIRLLRRASAARAMLQGQRHEAASDAAPRAS
jgi:phosphatidylglycerophosphate synthase